MRPYDQRLDHLLARAARVFADKGYHPTTMRDLSAASGMSLAGMYYYVSGKEDLLALIQERCFARVLEGAQQASDIRSEEHTSELQSQSNLVCRLLLEKKKTHIT